MTTTENTRPDHNGEDINKNEIVSERCINSPLEAEVKEVRGKTARIVFDGNLLTEEEMYFIGYLKRLFVKGAKDLYHGREESILRTSEGNGEIPAIISNPKHVETWIKEVVHNELHDEDIFYFTDSFYTKIARYALMYRDAIFSLLDKHNTTSQPDRKIAIMGIFNIIHAFGNTLTPTEFKKLLLQYIIQEKLRIEGEINKENSFQDGEQKSQGDDHEEWIESYIRGDIDNNGLIKEDIRKKARDYIKQQMYSSKTSILEEELREYLDNMPDEEVRDILKKFIEIENEHISPSQQTCNHDGVFDTTRNTVRGCIDLLIQFKDSARNQRILQKAYAFALEKSLSQEYIINEEKMVEYIETSFKHELKGIARIFNIFYYSDKSKDLTTENLKKIARTIQLFFEEISNLYSSGIAFALLDKNNLDKSFIENYFDSINLGNGKEKEIFLYIINQRRKLSNEMTNLNRQALINIIESSRKPDLTETKIIEVPNKSIDDISIAEFNNGSPGKRSIWFLDNIIKIEETNGKLLVTPNHSIPKPRANEKAFNSFASFMKVYYKDFYFHETDLQTHIETVINEIENPKNRHTISSLYSNFCLEMLIIRAWIKFYIINKDEAYTEETHKKYEDIFGDGSGARGMILQQLGKEGADAEFFIVSDQKAKRNSTGMRIQSMLDFNRENTEKGHIFINDERFKVNHTKNLLDIQDLYLPHDKGADLDTIIQFQKRSLDYINQLISNRDPIISENESQKYETEEYIGNQSTLVDEQKAYRDILMAENILGNKDTLWQLRDVLKYAIFISNELQSFYHSSQKDHQLLDNLARDFSTNNTEGSNNKMQELQQRIFYRFKKTLGKTLNVADIKRAPRTVQKSISSKKGVCTIADIVRGRKVDYTFSESVNSLVELLNFIKKTSYNDEIVQVIIGDNTGNPNELPDKISAYRDIKVHLRTKSGNLIEIQFVCKEINQYKEDGINIKDKFLKIYHDSPLSRQMTAEMYHTFEEAAKSVEKKIPRELKSMLPDDLRKKYRFNEDLYCDEKVVKSDFFYQIRRDHPILEFELFFGKIEGLYNMKIWGKILGELNEFFWQQDKGTI